MHKVKSVIMKRDLIVLQQSDRSPRRAAMENLRTKSQESVYDKCQDWSDVSEAIRLMGIHTLSREVNAAAVALTSLSVN